VDDFGHCSPLRHEWRKQCAFASRLPRVYERNTVGVVCAILGIVKCSLALLDAEKVEAALHLRRHERLQENGGYANGFCTSENDVLHLLLGGGTGILYQIPYLSMMQIPVGLKGRLANTWISGPGGNGYTVNEVH
jgi:hypothetical protein